MRAFSNLRAGRACLVAFAWFFGEVVLKFVFFIEEVISIGRAVFFDGDIRPNVGKFCVYL
jgi:hypothetical protein